ncbi:MAG: tetratricopeptide repeat protein [Planctomycetota bacterium]
MGSGSAAGIASSPGSVAQSPARSATPSTPETLWAAGERRVAIEQLAAQVAAQGPSASPATVERLVRWRLTVHQYAGALADLDRTGVPLDRLRGEALYALTRYDEALPLLDPEAPEHALLVIDALEALGRLDEAARALEAAHRTLAGDPRLHCFVGRIKAREGDHRAAVTAFRRALEADPVDLAAMFGLGRALIATGEREDGLSVLERHRACVPLVDALDFARQGLDLAPNSAPNLAAVADAERALGLLDKAQEHYRLALARADATNRTAIALRFARLRDEDLGDASGAVAVLEDAFVRERDVRLAVRAGDVLRRAERRTEAILWYERALDLRPGDRAILERLDGLRSNQ